jgi:hypothetical protein|tara:strand:- start:827 stop:940 length:114 start_codon:yes stop_codon:yes gene_type:complete
LIHYLNIRIDKLKEKTPFFEGGFIRMYDVAALLKNGN